VKTIWACVVVALIARAATATAASLITSWQSKDGTIRSRDIRNGTPYIDATTTGRWGGTGGAFAGTPCELSGTQCSFAELQAFLDDGTNPPGSTDCASTTPSTTPRSTATASGSAVIVPAAASALDWVAAIGGSVAALGAIVAAALGIRRVRREKAMTPAPAMSFDEDPASLEWAPVFRRKHRSLWLRFTVGNPLGKSTAREVQVLVTHVEAPPERRELVPGEPLLWTDVRIPTVDLPAGISRMVDVATVYLPDEEAPTKLHLQITLAEGDDRNELEPGAYDLELAVTAQDVDAVFYNTTIRFRNTWEQDPWELRRHLDVAPLRDGRLRRDSG
jgi:hypothetical protein